jgi:molecular chaperone HtpG
MADFFRQHLKDRNLDIEAKSLASDTLPGLILLDEKIRRLREYRLLTEGEIPETDFKKTFVVNTNNKLAQAALRLSDTRPDLARNLACQIYDLSCLSQKEIDPSDLEPIISRNQQLLEELTSLALQEINERT